MRRLAHDHRAHRAAVGICLEEADESGGARHSVELFNLADDPNERNDPAAENPPIVEDLQRRLEAYTAAAVPPLGGTPPRRGSKLPKVWAEPDG